MNHRISRGQFIKLRVDASPVRGISRLIRAFPVPTPILPRICRGSSAYCAIPAIADRRHDGRFVSVGTGLGKWVASNFPAC